MRTLGLVLLGGCIQAAPIATNWGAIAQGDGVDVAVERALYERPGSPHFFVHVRIANHGPADFGVDLRSYFDAFYPNQWGASVVDHREAIDERRLVLPAFDPDAIDLGALTPVSHGESIDYYSEFNASDRAEVDRQAIAPWVIVAMDGQIKLGGAVHAQRLVPDDALRDIAVPAPIVWQIVPANAKVVTD